MLSLPAQNVTFSSSKLQAWISVELFQFGSSSGKYPVHLGLMNSNLSSVEDYPARTVLRGGGKKMQHQGLTHWVAQSAAD